jgi:predicted amidohydrolase
MSEPVMVCAVQLSSQGEVEENLTKVSAFVGEAAKRGAQLVLLPENFAYFGDEEGKRALAEPLEASAPGEWGPIGRRLAELSRKHGVFVLGGGMPERSGDADRPFNTCAVFAPDGSLAGKYRKIHLFDVDLPDGSRYRESVASSAGDAPVLVDAAGLRVGLSICYDLRFPELYRAHAAAGAELLVVPAAFTLATGKDHWHVLLRARAIESQSYVMAAAQWGKHPRGRQTYGKSLIIDPWGEVIAQASEGEGVVSALVDRRYLAQVRASLPCLQHRRLGVEH